MGDTGEWPSETSSSTSGTVETTSGDTTSGDTTAGDTTAAPVNEPPSVALALSPEAIGAAGPVQLSIEVSDHVVELDVVYRGEVVATLPPEAFPYAFEVTSQRKCNNQEALTVVARDGEGLVADDTRELTCSLPASGSEAHQVLLPGKTSSMVHAVAVHGDGFVAAGALDGRMVVWRVGPDLQISPGWPRTIANWTGIGGLAALDSSAISVAVDADENIIVAGNTTKNFVTSYYVVKLNAAGARLAEAQGGQHEEAAGVVVTPDGLIVVVGSVKTSQQPVSYDWRVWGHAGLGNGPSWIDTLPVGPDEKEDGTNQRSERARAVAVLNSEELLVVGERDYQGQKDSSPATRASWQRYGLGGERIGTPWTSPMETGVHSGANGVVVLSGDVFALTGWMRSKLGQAPQAMSWRIQGGVLTDYRIAPVGLAEGRGLSRDREGNLVVASLMTNGGQLDAWSFAFAGWAAPKVWNAAPYGTPEGWDGYTAVTCTNWGYCLDGGFVTIDGALVGLLRLHNP